MYMRALRHVVRIQATSKPRLAARFYSPQSSEDQAGIPNARKVRLNYRASDGGKAVGGKQKSKAGGLGPLSEIKKTSEPLRILFCGSDDFSIASLRALHQERKRNPILIASIDVLCRPGKPAGRNLKTIREVPIKAIAKKLDLPIHECDTFEGWELPNPYDEPINLIIAVSFGLFIPAHILGSVKYGGLNVHPSILPDLRGPAPLQHTIISGREICGVTLQTLDKTSFDNGIILAQTPKHGHKLPFGDKCTYQDLLKFLTPRAATMLVKGIKKRVFVPPLHDVGWYRGDRQRKDLVHARKITAADKLIRWNEDSATKIERRYRALGRLWCNVQLGPDETKRVLFEGIEAIPMPEILAAFRRRHRGQKDRVYELEKSEEGKIRFFLVSQAGKVLFNFYVVDGDSVIIAGRSGSLRVKEITIEGKRKGSPAAQVLPSFADWGACKISKRESKGTVEWLREGHSPKLTGTMVDEGPEAVVDVGVKEQVGGGEIENGHSPVAET